MKKILIKKCILFLVINRIYGFKNKYFKMERTSEVTEIYNSLLNRNPSGEELDFFHSNPYDKTRIENIIKKSMEYYNKVLSDLKEEKHKKNQESVILLSNESFGGLITHSTYLKEKINGKVYIIPSNTELLINYTKSFKNLIWQNNFTKLIPKLDNQKYIYYVHTKSEIWQPKDIASVKNNHPLIDIYIFVSEDVKNSFFKNVFKIKNFFIIENEVKFIPNNKKEIKNFFISSGSYYDLKNHHHLVQEFAKLPKNCFLEIYGDIKDQTYFNNLKKLVKVLDHNIKLFTYSTKYIERLKEAEYFCLFSKSEGCCYSILEAMNFNKKIICSKECNNFDSIRLYPDKFVGKTLKIFEEKKGFTRSLWKQNIDINFLLSRKYYNKCAVIFFHKNIKKIYAKSWVEQCINSVLNQTYRNFDILEINYGNDDYSLFENFNLKCGHYFYKKDFPTHVEAMNFVINQGFNYFNYDVIFNTNLDDYYMPNRFEEQLEALENGNYLCSSMMNYINENNDVTLHWTPEKFGMKCQGLYIESEEIKIQLNKNHNVINHSCVAYHKHFWQSFDQHHNLLRYRDDKPFEDLGLWKRAINNDIPITIVNKTHIHYRIHSNQIGSKDTNSDQTDKGYKQEMSTLSNRVGIFLICTGSYINFLEPLITSIENNFLRHYPKTYFVSTDQVDKATEILKNYKHNIKHIFRKGFPLDTLYRYKYILEHATDLETQTDIVYYMDVDMKVTDTIDIEIYPTLNKPLIGTKHPGFAYKNTNGSPETSPLSLAFIEPNEYKNCYIAGGFNGGYTCYFLNMARTINKNINIDKTNDVMAVWHDESHLNRYFISNFDKFKVLSPEYCYPEKYHEIIPCNCRLLALYKNHSFVRNNFVKKKVLVKAMGGIGNILFQLGCGFALAKEKNMDLALEVNQKDELRESIFNYFLFDNVLRVKKEEDDSYFNLTESQKNYYNISEDLMKSSNVYLIGFFQSCLFFRNVFDDFKTMLNFKIKEVANIIMKEIKKKNNKKIVAMHVRGGDYVLKKDYHYNLTSKYYQNCLSHIDRENSQIILFTDDLKFAKQYENLYDISIHTILNKLIDSSLSYLKNAELDFFLISLCDAIICANSTFSLWASYFSNSSEIYIPNKWFTKESYQETKHFNPEELKLNFNYKILDS